MENQEFVLELKGAIYELIKEYHGRKRLKFGDIHKEMKRRYGASKCSRKTCQAAVRLLTDSGECEYYYASGSWIDLPRTEA